MADGVLALTALEPRGLWDRILGRLLRQLDRLGPIDCRLCCVDGSNVRAHKAAAGGGRNLPAHEPPNHALGCSRGGYRSKFHLRSDGRGRPLGVELSAGQAHVSRYFTPLLERARIGPRRRPGAVTGDRGYSYDSLRAWLARRRITALIPQRSDQIAQRGGQALPFDAKTYKRRNVIDRCVGRLKEARRIATRYEKLALHYRGVLKLATIQGHLPTLSHTP